MPYSPSMAVASLLANDARIARYRADNGKVEGYEDIITATNRAQAGDAIFLGAGQFNLNVRQIAVPVGGAIIGCGMNATKIYDQTDQEAGQYDLNPGGSGKANVRLTSNCLVANLTVQIDAPPGSSLSIQLPLGAGSNIDAAFTNASLYNVRVAGDSDALYIDRSSGACSVRAFDCQLISNYDAVVARNLSTHLIELYNCYVETNATLYANGNGTTESRGIFADSTTIRMFGGRINANGKTVGGSAFAHALSAWGATGFIEAFGVKLNAIGGDVNRDVYADNAASIVRTTGCSGSAAAGTLVSGGSGRFETLSDGFGKARTLTIATGVVTISGGRHFTIDTEAAAATDDLDTISGGTEGAEIWIRPANDARTVVVKHGTGNIRVAGAVDFSMDSQHDSCRLFHNGTNWLAQGMNGGT